MRLNTESSCWLINNNNRWRAHRWRAAYIKVRLLYSWQLNLDWMLMTQVQWTYSFISPISLNHLYFVLFSLPLFFLSLLSPISVSLLENGILRYQNYWKDCSNCVLLKGLFVTVCCVDTSILIYNKEEIH